MKKQKATIAGLKRQLEAAQAIAASSDKAAANAKDRLQAIVTAIYGSLRYGQTYDGALVLLAQLQARAEGIEGRADDRIRVLRDELDRTWDHIRNLSGVKGEKQRPSKDLSTPIAPLTVARATMPAVTSAVAASNPTL